MPLLGLVFMGLMFLVFLRSGGCMWMGGHRHASGELSTLQRDIESLKEDVRKLVRQPR